MTEVLCYNKGCGKKYDPTKNSDDSCQYHPGGPVFHDALKGWSCCKKRSTDFTQFLNFPGCTHGPHSNVKPVETEKKQTDVPNIVEEKVESIRQPVPNQVTERPSEDEPMIQLQKTVADSLKTALEKQLQKISLEDSKDKPEVDTNKVTIGTSCKNTGCKATYQGDGMSLGQCQYHPGVAIFHEGMKYWSCCNRKTSDFSSFLDQEGCESGKHLWIKKESADTVKSCRLDWFQTASNINISIFSKLAVPDSTRIEVNRVKCNIHIEFEGGKSLYEKTLVLKNAIDPSRSSVKMLGTKVEINLRKEEAFSWPSLELSPPVQSS